MAATHTTTKTNLHRTFGAVAILLALGILWLAFFGGGTQSSTGGRDFLGPSGSPLASISAGIQPIDSAILTSIPVASMATGGPLLGPGDKVKLSAAVSPEFHWEGS